MATFVYDQLSRNSTVQTVTRRMGLRGFALVLRILEECTDTGRLGMTAQDWATLLDCDPGAVPPLLEQLNELGVIKGAWKQLDQGLLMAALGDGLAHLLAAPDPSTVVYTRAAQWVEWMTCELSAPGWLTGDPASQELFRRWCASNATLAEMNQAAELAAQVPDLTPNGLFSAWKQVRAQRVALAYNRT